MNDHTQKMLEDARNEKFVDFFNYLAYDDININATDDKNKTMLHYACMYHWDSIIPKILEHFDVSINFPDHYGRTPLHYSPQY